MNTNPNTANICRISDEILAETSERVGIVLSHNCDLCVDEPIGAIITDGEVTGWHPTYENMDNGDFLCRDCSYAMLHPEW